MYPNKVTEQELQVLKLIPAKGIMADLIRRYNWSQSQLGEINTWPPSLLTSINIMLDTKFPMALYWGKDLIILYNDAYLPIAHKKHPNDLGKPFKEVWPEIWDVFEHLFQKIMVHGKATWADNQLLLLERNNYLEECYLTWSYSPVRIEDGGIGGTIAPVIETTKQVLNERRLKTLKELGEKLGNLMNSLEVAKTTVEVITQNSADIPFALIYLLSEESKKAFLMATSAPLDLVQASLEVDLESGHSLWPLKEALISNELIVVEQLRDKFDAFPSGLWKEPPNKAVIVPLVTNVTENSYGVLIMGLNVRRVFDNDYKSFVQLINRQLTNAISMISIAKTYENERRQTATLLESERNELSLHTLSRALDIEERQKKSAEFVDIICHEVRTPLNIMYGGITFLQEELNLLATLYNKVKTSLMPTQVREFKARINTTREYLKSFKAAATQQKELVDNLLNLSKLESGMIDINFKPFELKEMLLNIKEMFKLQFEQKNIKCILNMPIKSTIWLKGDKQSLKRILINLISNALKFTDKGSITINSSIELLSEREVALNFVIQDTGIGIKPIDIEKLFDRFVQVGKHKSPLNAGSGLGLAISKKLVELMGGSIKVKSQEGIGSQFIFSVKCIYLSKLEKQIIIAESKQNNQAGFNIHSSLEFKEKKILIVDDNVMNQKILASYVKKKNCLYELANDGIEALEQYYKNHFDLIFMDIEMPNMNGLEATQKIRAQEENTGFHIPIIGLSAYTNQEIQNKALESGMDSYLSKPCSQEIIYATISKYPLTNKMPLQSPPLSPQFSNYKNTANKSSEVNIKKIIKNFRNNAKSLLDENYPFIVVSDNNQFIITLDLEEIRLSPYINNIILNDLKKYLEKSLEPMVGLYIELDAYTQLKIKIVSNEQKIAITRLLREANLLKASQQPVINNWQCIII